MIHRTKAQHIVAACRGAVSAFFCLLEALTFATAPRSLVPRGRTSVRFLPTVSTLRALEWSPMLVFPSLLPSLAPSSRPRCVLGAVPREVCLNICPSSLHQTSPRRGLHKCGGGNYSGINRLSRKEALHAWSVVLHNTWARLGLLISDSSPVRRIRTKPGRDRASSLCTPTVAMSPQIPAQQPLSPSHTMGTS